MKRPPGGGLVDGLQLLRVADLQRDGSIGPAPAGLGQAHSGCRKSTRTRPGTVSPALWPLSTRLIARRASRNAWAASLPRAIGTMFTVHSSTTLPGDRSRSTAVPFLQDDQPFGLVAVLGVEHPSHPVLADGIAERRHRGQQVQQLADDRGLYIDHIAHSGTT